ncbi:hypothetical protein EYZ11_012819 [Aspergillus tanneri]|uniref:Nucleoside phosphorylase domain-containing protein n=1 Tax=Aspergillus tanneri TaxID=1220188 RepID=A0A4S3IZI1_9EURO|nr:hypothetical protein EYZ11_012819 [Aspergillus tanneri]
MPAGPFRARHYDDWGDKTGFIFHIGDVIHPNGVAPAELIVNSTGYSGSSYYGTTYSESHLCVYRDQLTPDETRFLAAHGVDLPTGPIIPPPPLEKALLDEEHDPLPSQENDDNSYLLSRMGKHNVVIVFPGSYGTNAASQTVTNMARSFRNIRFGLMVGVGGGAPGTPNTDSRKDIQLGDVAVSFPEGGHGKLPDPISVAVDLFFDAAIL